MPALAVLNGVVVFRLVLSATIIAAALSLVLVCVTDTTISHPEPHRAKANCIRFDLQLIRAAPHDSRPAIEAAC